MKNITLLQRISDKTIMKNLTESTIQLIITNIHIFSMNIDIYMKFMYTLPTKIYSIRLFYYLIYFI